MLATAAFYAMLAFNVFHVGEQIVPIEEDYAGSTSPAEIPSATSGEQYIQEAVEDIQAEQVHQAADAANQDKMRFQTICNADSAMCAKVVFEGTYTDKERYLYLGSIFKITNFINKYIATQQKVVDTLTKIAINKEAGKRRGYATWDTILINLGTVQDKMEFLELVSHEL